MSVNRILVIVLVVQAVFAALTWGSRFSGASGAPRSLVDLEREAITSIEITRKPAEGEAPDGVELFRDRDTWVVRSAADYPATPSKVESLLDKLLGLEVRQPIGTTTTSHKALKVGDDEYGRRIVIRAGDEERAWRVGAATSRSVNVRRDGEDDVYLARGASEWSFSDADSAYYDTSYVQADPAKLDAVSVHNANGDLVFEKEGDAWTLAGLEGGAVADAEAISSFLTAVTRVRLAAPVGKSVDPDYGLDAGARIDWTEIAEDQTVAGGYAVGVEVDTSRYVKAVDSPFVVKVASIGLQRLRDAKRNDFVKPSP